MTTILEALLIGSLIGLAYIYVGYPLLLALVSALSSNAVRKGHHRPRVTILIPAYNEAASIEATIRNKLELDYPADKREITVISDASTDGTDEIAAGFERDGVRLIRQTSRQGKTVALNHGVSQASGEIIVFSDANSIYKADALGRLTDNFSDPRVGYVTGKMIYTDSTGSVIGDGCSAYMKYENVLRSLETRMGSIVGVDGGIDAVRRELYRPMSADQLPDFILPLRVVEQGYRVVYEPRAILEESTLSDSRDEYRMRVRVTLRAMWAMHDMRGLLNVFRFSAFSWQLVSHKILRYSAFLFLLTAFVSNLLIWHRHPLWTALFLMQVVAYASTLLAWLLDRAGVRPEALYVPYYFTLINFASAHAFVKYLLGHKQVLWTPRKG